MPPERLLALLGDLDREAVEVWLDGGWGVDALLGEQTRIHKDVDLVVRSCDLPRLDAVLKSSGYAVSPGGTPTNIVYRNDSGLEVDIHAVAFDAAGNGNYQMANGGVWTYPAEGFSGCGSVAGTPVRCLTAEVQVLGHATGYTPTEKDIHDMGRLRERFGVTLPPHLTKVNSRE